MRSRRRLEQLHRPRFVASLQRELRQSAGRTYVARPILQDGGIEPFGLQHLAALFELPCL
jgi:hypothetical protein